MALIRYTDNLMGFLELQALIVLCAAMSSCVVDKYHTQPGIHHYEHCKEVGVDVKRDVLLIECPLEQEQHGKPSH